MIVTSMSVSNSEIESVFEEVVTDLFNSGKVSNRAEINDGFCSIVAAEVYERLDRPSNVDLCRDVKRNHYWLESGGLFFDAERTRGVSDWSDLPYWSRHNIPSGGFEYDTWAKHTGF